MKKPNVVVFDVDHTLINGNLTFFFLRTLIKEKLYFFRKCFIILLRGALLTMLQLPHLTKTTLTNGGNVYRLDRHICDAIKTFYQNFSITLNQLDLLGDNLEEKAKKIFSENFFKKHMYRQGFQAIKYHLQKPNQIVVLLSGSPQELLNVFFASLCKQLDNEEIDWHNKFFAQGSELNRPAPGLQPRERCTPCIGSEKNKILKKLLAKHGFDDYTIATVYSDNGFMADLPLLIEAKNGSTLISKKSSLYNFLPKNLIHSFIFLPSWEEE